MERIKQALEKAKRNAPQRAEASNAKIPSDTSVQKAELDELCYSQTQIVQLDPQHLEANRIIAFNKSEAASTKFDILRTQVLRKMEEKGWRSVAIVSPTAGAGKTVVAVNLAIAIAQQTDKTAMLVDFDLRKPSVARVLGIEPEKSLNDVFSGEAQLAEALVNPGIARLVILPTNHSESRPAETLASKRTQELIAQMRERYEDRILLFDLPPLLSVDDALAVLPNLDCALVIVGNGESTKHDIQDTFRHLGSTSVLGIVLNKAGTLQKTYY